MNPRTPIPDADAALAQEGLDGPHGISGAGTGDETSTRQGAHIDGFCLYESWHVVWVNRGGSGLRRLTSPDRRWNLRQTTCCYRWRARWMRFVRERRSPQRDGTDACMRHWLEGSRCGYGVFHFQRE